MGAFFLVRKTAGNDAADQLAKARASMTAQGFSDPRHFALPDYDLFLYDKQVSGTKNFLELDSGDFCTSTGTLLHQGKFGEAALQALYDAFDPAIGFPSGSLGTYCVVIRKQEKTYLFIDPLGIYKVYTNADKTVWSSSFLGLLSTLDQPTIDSQSVYEYVFNGATYGNDTIFEEIKLLDCGGLVEIGTAVEERRSGIAASAAPAPTTNTNDAEHQLDILRRIYADIISCFGDKIDTALSGGYDSRLTLALLMEQDILPKVHVYGKDSDSDVQVAKTIDAAMDLALVHTDKSSIETPTADQFPDVVKANYLSFDGYPPDGIFGSNADFETRKARCSNGCLTLNGGGGEIYRNFFYLPNSKFTVRQVLHSFYAQFDPSCCTTRFSESAYFQRLGDKVKGAIGASSDQLDRTQVELIYPMFRCRYWMGRNNAVNNRLGYALTPFIEHETVKAAAAIAMDEKNSGKLQGKMINAVSPRLASFNSSYGHSFSDDPPLKRKLSDLQTLLRPSWLRKQIFRIKHSRRPNERPRMMTDAYLQPVIGTDFPVMSNYLHVATIKDPVQLNRICTLEFLFKECSPELPSS